MKIIKPAIRKRRFLGIAGVLFVMIGIALFPKTILTGYIEILPLVISSAFLVAGLLSSYFACFYEIIIDDSGISTGSVFLRKKVFKEQIRGYFLVTETPEKGGPVDLLILLLVNGNQKQFDAETLGIHFDNLKDEISKKYQLLPASEHANYLSEKEQKKIKWVSYIGLAIFLFGAFLLGSSIQTDFDLISIEGSLKEKPSIDYNRHKTSARINIQLNEFANHTFSQVKNVHLFENWLDKTYKNDEVTLEISRKDYDTKIKNANLPDKVILNYSNEAIEIRRLKNSNHTYIYKENRFKDISLPIFIMIFGLGSFVYYRRKKMLM